jgi:hypothetical protein
MKRQHALFSMEKLFANLIIYGTFLFDKRHLVIINYQWIIYLTDLTSCALALEQLAYDCIVCDTQRFHLVELIPLINMLLFFFLIRLFVSKCAKCHQSFSKNDLFIRTTFYRRFHTDCFRCDQCDRLLTSGDEYYLHRQNEIFCRQHFQQLTLNETSSTESKSSCSDSAGIPTTGKKTYAVHTHWHPFGCDYGVKEGIDGMLFMTEVRSVWGALFSRYILRLLISQYRFFLSLEPDAANKCTCRLIRNIFNFVFFFFWIKSFW